MSIAVPEEARYEIKFVSYARNLTALIRWINSHPAGFFEPYPERHVNNVYFDTFDCIAFSENLSGASARTKVRYRWYGDSEGPDSGKLEIKRKRNYFGWKTLFPVMRAPYSKGDSWNAVIKNISKQIPYSGRLWLEANPMPVILNRYYRKYYLSHDGRIRVTLDTNQSVCDQRYKPFLNFKHKANMPDTFVVEIKFDRKNVGLASNLLRGIPLRVSRHSKYINGVRAISGYK